MKKILLIGGLFCLLLGCKKEDEATFTAYIYATGENMNAVYHGNINVRSNASSNGKDIRVTFGELPDTDDINLIKGSRNVAVVSVPIAGGVVLSVPALQYSGPLVIPSAEWEKGYVVVKIPKP